MCACSAAAYAVPPDEESVEAILARERFRVEETLAPLTPQARQRAMDNLGLCRVRVCGEKQPYDLALEAATAAIAEAGITREANRLYPRFQHLSRRKFAIHLLCTPAQLRSGRGFVAESELPGGRLRRAASGHPDRPRLDEHG